MNIGKKVKRLLLTLVLTLSTVLTSAQTVLPAVRIDCESELSNETEVMGTFVLETPDETTGNTKKESYMCMVNYRGATSSMYDKKSLEVELVDEDGESLDVNVLGLREENSKWNLDALASDHSGLRNRVAMDMFTSYSKLPYTTDYDQRYSTVGRYVELWLNGQYRGLYCLSDRVDRNLTGIKKVKDGQMRGVLYKCTSHGPRGFLLSYDSLPTGNEFVWNARKLQYPNSASPEAWQPLINIFNTPWADIPDEEYVATVGQYFYWDNMVDVYLLTMVLGLGDFGFKNTYLACSNYQKDQRMIIVPWDLDYTFGSTWNGILWSTLTTLRGKANFQFANPFKRLLSNPDLGFLAAVTDRWMQLKDNALSVEMVSQRIEDYAQLLDESGAWQRNREVWDGNPIALDNTAKEAADWMTDWYAANYKRVDELLQPYIATGIMGKRNEQLKMNHKDDVWYDLQGRRANPSTTTKGILINNHKKVVR